MQPRKHPYYLALATLLTVTGCGGGGGGGGGGDAVTPPPPPPPPDKYEASSYNSDGTSNQSLTGLWMMVEESHTKQLAMPGFGQPGDYSETQRKRRSTINFVDHGNGTATAYNCVDASAEITSVNLNGSTIQVPIDGTLLQLTIVNNQRLEGTFVTNPAPGNLVTVLSGTATLIKIDDQPSLPSLSSNGLGTVSVQVTTNGTPAQSFDNKKVYCFTQEQYEAERQHLGAFSTSSGNAIEFISAASLPIASMVAGDLLDVEIFYDGEPAVASEVVLSNAPLAPLRNTSNPTLNLADDSVSAVRGEVSFNDEQSSTTSARIQFQIGF